MNSKKLGVDALRLITYRAHIQVLSSWLSTDDLTPEARTWAENELERAEQLIARLQKAALISEKGAA